MRLPGLDRPANPPSLRWLDSVWTTIEHWAGRREGRITTLASGATDEQMRNKINELIGRLQGD
jgi:hypothetical protein